MSRQVKNPGYPITGPLSWTQLPLRLQYPAMQEWDANIAKSGFDAWMNTFRARLRGTSTPQFADMSADESTNRKMKYSVHQRQQLFHMMRCCLAELSLRDKIIIDNHPLHPSFEEDPWLFARYLQECFTPSDGACHRKLEEHPGRKIGDVAPAPYDRLVD
jgi:hypothetical protein